MKNAVLLHGTGGNNTDYFWFGDTKQYLEEHGYAVWWPELPNTDKPILEDTMKFVLDTMPEPDEEMIIIGHSSGCPLILSLLQRFEQPIKQAVLVSGYYQSLPGNEQADLMLEPYDWDRIRRNAHEIVLFNSDNDPWGCDDRQARPVAEKLGAKFVFMEGEGHMGSGAFYQPYPEFPKLNSMLAV